MTMRTRARSLSRGVESRIDLTGSALTTTSTSTPHFGDMVTFTISTTETSNPFVNLNCYQNGILVSVGWSAFFRGGTGQDFGL
jgi:hypothetical protein